MTTSGTFSFDAPGDAARAAELRRVKALATLVLAGTLAVFITAKSLLHVHPVFGFVAAFAEAATIGGLADWYAVVALFRRPLGLPIPHTAIIQANQHRIADKLGEFIEVHFLEAAPVDAKLRQIDFGSFIADWLRDRKRSTDLARFTLRLLPEAVSATETSGLMTFITRRIQTLSGRQVSGEQDRRISDHVFRGSSQRSQASVPWRIRSHDIVVRGPARQRSKLCRSSRRVEARPAGASRTRRPRAQYLVERAIVYRTQRQRRDPGAAATPRPNVHEVLLRWL